MANTLPTEKKILAVSMLAEGASIRAVERITAVHRDTIMRLGVRVGHGCATSKAPMFRLMRFGASSARKRRMPNRLKPKAESQLSACRPSVDTGDERIQQNAGKP
jgi:hypothetical protein